MTGQLVFDMHGPRLLAPSRGTYVDKLRPARPQRRARLRSDVPAYISGVDRVLGGETYNGQNYTNWLRSYAPETSIPHRVNSRDVGTWGTLRTPRFAKWSGSL